MPAFQATVGIAFVASIILLIFGVATFAGTGLWWLAFLFLVGLGGTVLGCVARGARTGLGGVLLGLLIVPVYAAYSWLIWPALFRATTRALMRRSDWAKTTREPVELSANVQSDARVVESADRVQPADRR